MDDLVPVPSLQALAAELLKQEGLESLTPEQAKAQFRGSTDVGNVSYVCPTQFMELDPCCGKVFRAHTQEALELAAQLQNVDPKARIMVVDYEPVTGSHVGPGALALFYVAREDACPLS